MVSCCVVSFISLPSRFSSSSCSSPSHCRRSACSLPHMKAKRAQLLAGALGALVAVVCLMVPLVFPWYHTHVATYAHCGTSTSRHLFYQYFHCSCGNNWSLCHPTQTQKSALLQRNLDAVLATDINEFESWWATCGASGTESTHTPTLGRSPRLSLVLTTRYLRL